jgi:hypothetical protein
MADSSGIGIGTGVEGAAVLGGLGLGIFGAVGSYNTAQEEVGTQSQIVSLQEQQDMLRERSMFVASRRQSMEVLRKTQQARAQALQAGVSNNAQFSSGLQGGYGQVAGQGQANLLGVNQSVGAGMQMFGLNSAIGQQKINYAQEQAQAQQDQSEMSLGKSLIGLAGPLGKLAGLAFGL